jgi:hypothetical protein
VPPGRAKRPGIVVLTLPLYRKYRIFEPVFHFFRRGGGRKAFQEACREAGPRQEQGRKGRKRRRMKRKEKERVCTWLMELLETGRAAPNPVRLSAAAQEILADTRACYKVKENSNSKRK